MKVSHMAAHSEPKKKVTAENAGQVAKFERQQVLPQPQVVSIRAGRYGNNEEIGAHLVNKPAT